MSMGELNHSGYISADTFFTVDSNGYFTTTENNQTINFIKDGQKYTLNSIRIFADSTNLKVKISQGILYIGANDVDGLDKVRIEQIQILNPTGTKLRFDGLFF